MGISAGGEVKRVGKGLTTESPWQDPLIWSVSVRLPVLNEITGNGPCKQPSQ